ncbi:MAG: HAD hydrolase family protein, partial [Erysipelotrichaceae bacterium]|nr:HAD hydrolase family protein [Erysipelotrichaceae bacterium]
MGKYLFFDVDRTLLDSRDLTVPESAETALRMAAANGHHLFLCTGRSVYSLKELKELPVEGIIFCNGA